VQIDHNDLYPYLLVNIGSGVSMIKVLISASDSFMFSFVYLKPFRRLTNNSAFF